MTALGRLLEPYRIGSRRRRLDGPARHGYFRADFEDAWTRYVPDVPVVPGSQRPTQRQEAFDLDDYPVSATDPDEEE